MLNILRSQKVQKRIYIVLAVAIIASFGVSGVLISHDDKKTTSSIGQIHGRKISVQDYLASYKAVDHQARIMYGKAFDQVRPYVNFKGEAWDRLLLLSYAKKNNIKATDREVVEWIGEQPFLQNHGQFDDRAYKMFLSEYLHAEPRRFEEEVREMLTIGKIQDKIQAGIRLNDTELKELYAQEHGEREIQYVVYSAPADSVAVSEEELKQIYPLYQDNLKEPAKAKIRYLLIPEEKKEEFKEAAADEKSTLETLSKKYGLPIVESAYFSKNEAIPGLGLVNEVIEKSFSLASQQSSGWIPTPSGACKIELVDKIPAKALSFEEAKEKLKDILAHQKTVEASLKKLNELAKDIKPEEFEKFAADQKLEIKSMQQFKEGAYVPGIGPSTFISKAMASLKEGGMTKPIPVPGGAALIKIVKNKGADEKEFKKVKAEFSKKVLQDRSQGEMEKLLESLRKELVPNMELLKEIFPEEQSAK